MTTWRASPWARWLGWTLVFALVVGGSALVYTLVEVVLPLNLLPVFYVPSLVASFLIGARFRSWWWAAGPPALILTLGTALILPMVVEPHTSRGTPTGTLIFRDEAVLAMISIVPVLALVGVVYGLVATAGVWWGRRREAANADSISSGPSGDLSM